MYVCVHEHTGTYIQSVGSGDMAQRFKGTGSSQRGCRFSSVRLPARQHGGQRQVPSLKLVAQRRDLVISAALTLCAAQPDMIENL